MSLTVCKGKEERLGSDVDVPAFDHHCHVEQLAKKEKAHCPSRGTGPHRHLLFLDHSLRMSERKLNGTSAVPLLYIPSGDFSQMCEKRKKENLSAT